MASLTNPSTPVLDRLKPKRVDSIKLNKSRLAKLKIQMAKEEAAEASNNSQKGVSFASPRSLVTREVTYNDVTFASPRSLVQVTDDNQTDPTPEKISALPPHVLSNISKITSSTDSMKLNKKRVSTSSKEASLEEVATLPKHVRDLASKLNSTTDSMKLNHKRLSRTSQEEASPEEIKKLPPHVRDLASKLNSTTDSMKLNKERMGN